MCELGKVNIILSIIRRVYEFNFIVYTSDDTCAIFKFSKEIVIASAGGTHYQLCSESCSELRTFKGVIFCEFVSPSYRD